MNSYPLSDIRSAKIEQACNDNFMDINAVAHMPEISARPFQCEGCDKSYMHASSLRRHRRMKHMNETFDCTNCHEKFVFKSSLARHMVRSHPGRTQVRCQGVELPSSKGPMSTNAAGSVPKITIKPFQCLTCDKSYKLKGALRAHHEAAHTDSTFDCGGCNEKLPYVSSLAYHLAMFSGRRLPKAWPCSSCNKAYDKFCWYNRHFLAVHAKHAYCSGCMEVDLHNADYREHSRSQELGCGGKHVTFLCSCCYNLFRVCNEPWKLSSRGGRTIFPCFLCSFYSTSPLAIYEHRGRAHMVCKSCRD